MGKFVEEADVTDRYEGDFPSGRLTWLETRIDDVEADLILMVPSLGVPVDQIDPTRLQRVKALVADKILELYRNPERARTGDLVDRQVYGWYPGQGSGMSAASASNPGGSDYERRITTYAIVQVPNPEVYSLRDKVVLDGLDYFVAGTVMNYNTGPFSVQAGWGSVRGTDHRLMARRKYRSTSRSTSATTTPHGGKCVTPRAQTATSRSWARKLWPAATPIFVPRRRNGNNPWKTATTSTSPTDPDPG
jgi:hypothetical protein